MLNLKKLCFDKIINDDSINIEGIKKLPIELIEEINILKIKKECGNIVTDTLKDEYESITWDEYFKSQTPILKMIYDKKCVASGIKIYLEHFKDKKFYNIFPRRDYIIYYLKQNKDYKKIYPQENTSKLFNCMKINK